MRRPRLLADSNFGKSTVDFTKEISIHLGGFAGLVKSIPSSILLERYEDQPLLLCVSSGVSLGCLVAWLGHEILRCYCGESNIDHGQFRGTACATCLVIMAESGARLRS